MVHAYKQSFEYGLTVDTLSRVRQLLIEALGAEWVSDDPAILTCYFRDFTARVGKWPNLVVLPSSTEEVQAVVRIAHEHRIPVVPYSTGFNHGGTALPQWGGILVDLKRMDRVLAVDEEGMTITLQPYVGNARVYTVANEFSALEGLPLKPAIPMTMGSASTLCNYVSRGFSGIAGKHGGHSENIVNMTWVLPDGEIVKFGPGSFPNVGDVPVQFGPGPDLSGMFISADGMMGICTEITIKLFPEQAHEKMYYLVPNSEGIDALRDCIDFFYEISRKNLMLFIYKMCHTDALIMLPDEYNPADFMHMIPEHAVMVILAGLTEEELAVKEEIVLELAASCNLQLAALEMLAQMIGVSMHKDMFKKIYQAGKVMKPKGSFQWIAGYYRLDRVPELMEDYKNIVMRYWKPSDPKISYALAMSGTHIQGPLPFGRATTIEFDFWWDPGNPEQVKRAILTLRQMGEMMMDHGVMFAKNLVGTYELLPRLGTYYDLVCRAKAMTDPLHIMHPDVMPVGKGYSPPSE
jgi:FAD/FMN-containing dehydrogenase